MIQTKMPVKIILLDIEGTTTPIEFVYKILFPYARARLKDYLLRHSAEKEVRAIVADLFAGQDKDRGEGAPRLRASKELDEAEVEEIAAYCQRLMDEDRKATALKALQGKVWEEGYESGELKSEVFPDVAVNLRLWRDEGIAICIYSSGSVLAQKLLFAHTSAGDLTRLIDGFFDTATGHKTEAESYTKIAGALRQRPSEIMFISDVAAELDAAANAGLRTLLCVRPGNRPQNNSYGHEMIHTFDDFSPGGAAYQ